MNEALEKKHSFLQSYHLPGILIFAFLARLVAVIITGDRHLDEEWAILVNYMDAGLGYSFYRINDTPLPSARMPALYAFLLYLFHKAFFMIKDLMFVVGIFQAILGVASCYLTYKIAGFRFNKSISILSAVIIASFPLFVYSSGQCSSVNLYVFLNLLIVYFLLKNIYVDSNIRMDMVFAGLFSGLMILTRSEFLMYIPFIVLWIFLKNRKDLIKPLIYIFITIIVISPWYIRNYVVFDTVLFSPQIGGGENLWRGHHPGTTSDGDIAYGGQINADVGLGEAVNAVNEEIEKIIPTNRYEIHRDQVFMKHAVNFMRGNVILDLFLAGDKFVAFWFHDFDSKYPGITSPLYWLPWIILIGFFAKGLVATRKEWEKYLLFYIYFILHTMIMMAFFVIPRYRLFILPFISIFASAGFYSILRLRTRVISCGYN